MASRITESIPQARPWVLNRCRRPCFGQFLGHGVRGQRLALEAVRPRIVEQRLAGLVPERPCDEAHLDQVLVEGTSRASGVM